MQLCNDSGWAARHDHVRCHVAHDNSSSCNYAVFTDRYAGVNDGVAANPNVLFYADWFDIFGQCR